LARLGASVEGVTEPERCRVIPPPAFDLRASHERARVIERQDDRRRLELALARATVAGQLVVIVALLAARRENAVSANFGFSASPVTRIVSALTCVTSTLTCITSTLTRITSAASPVIDSSVRCRSSAD
jgi:hypothetical protein